MNVLPEERELERLEVQQEQVQDRVAVLELELETLKTEISRFQHRYYETAGRLYAEVDYLRAKIARVRASQLPGDEKIQREAEDAEIQARKSAEEAGLLASEDEPPLEITPELKQAYRYAAKLIHPDRATTDSERNRRTKLMQQVNFAYECGDEATIQKIVQAFGQDPEAISGTDVASKIVKAIRRIAQLQRRIGEIEQEFSTLRASEIHELRVTVEEAEAMGGDPLGDLASNLLVEISELKIEYEQLCES